MDKVLDASRKLRKYLFDMPEVKEYFVLLKAFENDLRLSKLRSEIIELETRFRNGEEVTERIKTAKKEYDSDPLVINYRQSSRNVIELLEEIKRIIV